MAFFKNLFGLNMRHLGQRNSTAKGASKALVGVAMPTQAAERWFEDGRNLKTHLGAGGYEVDIQYADDDVLKQISQIGSMIENGVVALVIGAHVCCLERNQNPRL